MATDPDPCVECSSGSCGMSLANPSTPQHRTLLSATILACGKLRLKLRSLAAAKSEFKQLEDEWHHHQQQLSDDIEKLKSSLTDLKQKRQQLVEETESQAVGLYEKIRQQKKPPVAKVERGICHVCRISLSASELQRVRSGNPVLCGSCGRILFLP